MKRFYVLLMVAGALLAPAQSKKKQSPFAGRWDITVTTPNGMYPNWMELVETSEKPEARFQPRAGSVRNKSVRTPFSNLDSFRA